MVTMVIVLKVMTPSARQLWMLGQMEATCSDAGAVVGDVDQIEWKERDEGPDGKRVNEGRRERESLPWKDVHDVSSLSLFRSQIRSALTHFTVPSPTTLPHSFRHIQPDPSIDKSTFTTHKTIELNPGEREKERVKRRKNA